MEALRDYLHFLDNHSTQQFCTLEYNENVEMPESEHDIFYYVSQK